MSAESNHSTPDHAAIREELLAKLSSLIVRARGIDDDLRDPVNDDWEERASEQEEDEVLAKLGNATMREIKQIKQALHEIEMGTYGRCTRCGVPINPERLEVLPFATTCVKCA